jgi:AcrR family transcriptional regulator
MAVPRQAPVPDNGRVNQKLRTRAAIVEAAQALVEDGVTPTVAQAAEAAMVSRTTAYRYFPTQESLLVELSVTIDVPDLEAIVATPVDADGVNEKVQQIVDGFNRHVLADEVLYRRAMRTYLDLWFANADDDELPTVRQGRRTRWIATALEPLHDRVPNETLRRVEAALCLVMGIEAMVVMRDVCRFDEQEARAVARWAAETILTAAITASTEPPRGRRTAGRATRRS